MHQIRLRPGLCPRPRWRSSQRSPRLPSWILGVGVLLLTEGKGGGKGKEKGREGRERRRGEERGERGRKRGVASWLLGGWTPLKSCPPPPRTKSWRRHCPCIRFPTSTSKRFRDIRLQTYLGHDTDLWGHVTLSGT